MKPKNAEDFRKFQTFPSKSGAQKGPQFAPGANKFQQMATFHKQQESTGDYRNAPQHRKIHFGGTPKMQYREGGKFYKPPVEVGGAKGKVGGAKGGPPKKTFQKNPEEKVGGAKKQRKVGGAKKKGPPAKGTSQEYRELANSDDEDSDDVMDVEDMLEESEDVKDSEIPMVNTLRVGGASSGVPKKGAEPKPQARIFNALGEYEEGAEPKSKKQKTSEVQESPESDDVDSEGENPPEEDSEDSNDDDDDDEEERLKFRAEISQMPLGKVREMKEKLGIKLFNKTYFGTSEVEKKQKVEKKKEAEKGGQHRPKEISSKRPVSTFRNIYGDHEKGTKKKKWDPRFDARAGDFKEVCFENNYQFLDDIRSGEMADIRNELKKAREEGDERKAERLKNTLHKMETREKTRAEKRRQAETRKELHDDNIDRMLRGEAPIFRTKAQVRRIDAEKKYEELKKDNKLDKYLQRKAKKESAKQKKARPPFEGYGYGN